MDFSFCAAAVVRTLKIVPPCCYTDLEMCANIAAINAVLPSSIFVLLALKIVLVLCCTDLLKWCFLSSSFNLLMKE